MKKIFASLTIFAAMLAGCQKPELDVPAGAEETFTATVEAFGALTRTSLTSNNQIAWSDGDRLAVFQANTLADEYKLIDGCDGLTNGSFRIVANNVTLNGDFSAGTEIPCNVALYPYYEDLTLSVAKTEDKKLYDISNVVLPQTQLYTENSFANGAFMMAAVTETFKDHNLKFKNVMGAVKLQFKGAKTVKTVKIEGNNNELLSGAAVVTVREDNLNPTVKMLQNASTEVVLDCGEGVVLNETEATEFIIALPPVKFEAGFTVTVTDSEGAVNTVTSNRTDNAVVRSGILVMPAMTLGEGTVVPEPEPDPEVENWSLITSMDEWTEDIPLEYDGTFYYAKGLELEGYVKFRRDADWEVNFGSVSLKMNHGLLAANDAIVPLAYNGMDICLEKNTYDVYLDLENARAWFMTAGSVPTPVSYEWGVVGEVNGWGENDIPMAATDTKGLFVAKNIEMPDGGFKIRANSKWEDDANYGLNAAGNLTPDYYYRLSSSGNTGDMLLSAGTYDIWFDLFNAMVYVMSPGKDISDAPFGEPVAPAPGPDPEVPELKGWGISGTNTNNFADGADIMMENDGIWYVAKGVEFGEGDRFKIRQDGKWVLSFGFVEYDAEFKVNEEVTLTSENGYDMFPVAGIYDIYFNPETGKAWFINDGSYPTGGTPIPDVPVLTGWGVVGTITGWADGADIMMENDGIWYVAKGVEFGAEDMFKIRQDGKWDVSFGGEFKANEEVILTSIEGPDIAAAAGTYDIYFNPETGKAWFINDGSYPVEGEDPVPELPNVEGEASQWGIVGDVNGWGTPDVTMYNTATAGLFVAKNVQMPAGGFKIRANNEWNDAANYGPEIAGAVEVDHVYDLICGAGSYNMTLTAGTYDIWFDLTNSKVYIMSPGKDISEATAVKPEAPLAGTWYLVGNFNGWTPADDDYMMTKGTGWYIFKNFKADGQGVKFVADANWNENRGGIFASGSAIELHQGGADMLVEEGEYDVYLSADASKAYFMKPGETPSL